MMHRNERVVAPRKRIEALVTAKTTPRNRSEAEIAGYRAALDLIHEADILPDAGALAADVDAAMDELLAA